MGVNTKENARYRQSLPQVELHGLVLAQELKRG